MNYKKIFPILDWLPSYKREFFKNDLSAGLVVGIMLMPQGIAYAMIAGLPPIYGLY
ncbi:MAG: SulP family inorganic anion transporter, partial [Lutibacter sp.]|nr:SulP family inorganic anion transporter [Lutibacter sp.]